MKIGIMQPYFLPYIGYFQLINSVDKFIIYDDVQYIKRGWINKNKMLVNNNAINFILSIKNDSHNLNINERYFSDEFKENTKKLLKGIERAYKKAPYFSSVMPLIIESLNYDSRENVANFIYNSLEIICNYIQIDTKFIKSSQIEKSKDLKGQAKIIDIVKRVSGDTYINSIGGSELYSKDIFKTNDIELKFIKSKKIEYRQFNEKFIPNLSILDILMFNSTEKTKEFINQYELI